MHCTEDAPVVNKRSPTLHILTLKKPFFRSGCCPFPFPFLSILPPCGPCVYISYLHDNQQCLKMTLYIVTDIKLYKHVHYTKDPSSCLYFEPVVNKQARRKISASSEVLLKSIRSVTLSKDGISVSLVLPDHHDLATHKARAAATADEGSEPPPFNKMRVYVDDRRGFVAEVEGRGPKPPVGGGIDR